MGDRRGQARKVVTPSTKGERYLSPREVKVVLFGTFLLPILLGVALLLLTPRDTLLSPAFWLGIGFWTVLAGILVWHEVSRQMPEAAYFRRTRTATRGSRHHLKWVTFALLVLVLGIAKWMSYAPPTSWPGAFSYGIAGGMLSMGIGYGYELIGREKLQYCSTCEGHRWYIRYQGQIVCGVCGKPWAGEDTAWARPGVDSRHRETHHAMLEYFAAGPMLVIFGIFGVLALPEVGLGEWVGVAVLVMFGGLVSTIILAYRFRRRVAEIQKS